MKPRTVQQCLILTKDPFYGDLLEMTLKQHEFRPRVTTFWERMGSLTSTLPTVAWFIDLDALTLTVPEIVEQAKVKAPDARMIFFSSRFTGQLAGECIQNQAFALLVKPFNIERLVQTIVLMREEPELAERGDLIPKTAGASSGHYKSDPGTPFKKVHFACPVCKTGFLGSRFKIWVFPVSDTDSDFCPNTTGTIHPELYSVMVCPTCLYANYVGQFSTALYLEHLKRGFLDPQAIQERKKISFNLNFQETRTLVHGVKSFELAATSALDLISKHKEKLAGEFYLKSSWLCRKAGHVKQEKEVQEKALLCFKKVYQPFVGHQVSRPDVPGGSELSHRAILVTGYLAGELSRRLGLLDQARFYIEDVTSSPHLQRYSSLLSQVHATLRVIRKAMSEEGNQD